MNQAPGHHESGSRTTRVRLSGTMNQAPGHHESGSRTTRIRLSDTKNQAHGHQESGSRTPRIGLTDTNCQALPNLWVQCNEAPRVYLHHACIHRVHWENRSSPAETRRPCEIRKSKFFRIHDFGSPIDVLEHSPCLANRSLGARRGGCGSHGWAPMTGRPGAHG